MKRELDRFDMEAEAEGNAIRNFRTYAPGHAPARSHAKNKNGKEARPTANGGGNNYRLVRLQSTK